MPQNGPLQAGCRLLGLNRLYLVCICRRLCLACVRKATFRGPDLDQCSMVLECVKLESAGKHKHDVALFSPQAINTAISDDG